MGDLPDVVDGYLDPEVREPAPTDRSYTQSLSSRLLDKAFGLRGKVLLVVSVVAFVLLSYVVLTTSFSGEDPNVGTTPTGEDVSEIDGDAKGSTD